jgi:uncharacterized protein (DUF1778 family)
MPDRDNAPPERESRAMRIVSVRFGAGQIALVQQEADREGVSASQFIRDAAWARAVLNAARENATTVLMWEKLIAAVEAAGHDVLGAELHDLMDEVEHEHHAA